MKIVLATGIYPPEIGGPATYVQHLAEQLVAQGHEVIVVTYGALSTQPVRPGHPGGHSPLRQGYEGQAAFSWNVVVVPKSGGPLLRWMRYAKALKAHASNADHLIAFSSVSCGVPLWIARLQKPRTRHSVPVQGRPKKYLRLGGDFLWERYTDRGGRKTLREYRSLFDWWMEWLLNTFDHIIFSTQFQQEIYERRFKKLPSYSVIENALPSGIPMPHEQHNPLRILFMGRFVRFKNLITLLDAIADEEGTILTLVGNGPEKERLQNHAAKLHLHNRMVFLPPAHGDEKLKVFSAHDLLILPSITEISPNVALEARAAGLPVLLSTETGFSSQLSQGMVIQELHSGVQIKTAIRNSIRNYNSIASQAASHPPDRPWSAVAQDWLALL